MDNIISSVSELEKALEGMTTYTPPTEDSSVPNIDSTVFTPSISKVRTSTSQYSTLPLLMNLIAAQTLINFKLGTLSDNILRMHKTLELMHTETVKHTDLLATLTRNTIPTYNPSADTTYMSSTPRSKTKLLKDYGFNTTWAVISELLIKLLKQLEIQIVDRGIRYRSQRTLTEQIMSQAIKSVCSTEFKTESGYDPLIKAPDSKNIAVLHVASVIGSDAIGVNPILTPASIRELFDDIKSRPVMSLLQDAVDRLRTVSVLVPHFEGDILKATPYPFFNSQGLPLCNFAAIVPRSETENERLVMDANATMKQKVSAMLCKSIAQ